MSEYDLNNNLRFFYSKLSRQDGRPYSCSSLLCIRAAIHRFLTTSPVNRTINIITDRQFLTSNNMLKAKVSESISSGNATKHFAVIEAGDQEKLFRYFDQSSPVKLQQEIWYNLIYYFGNRGREGIRELSKDDVSFTMDSDGKEYCFLNKTLSQKNVKSSLTKPSDFDNTKQSRMYADDLRSSSCPVQAMKLYLSKIPSESKSLFPRPRQEYVADWYYPKQCLGKTVLGKMMPQISKDAKLSKLYTNHSIRATVVTNLREEGFERNEVCAITGHKNEKSIEKYDRSIRERTLKKMSTSLGEKRRKVENKSFETDKVKSTNVYNFSGNVQFINCNFS